MVGDELHAVDSRDEIAVKAIASTIGNVARTLAAEADGQVTPMQRAQFSTNVFGALFMMHRQYLPQLIYSNYGMSKQWDYNSQRWVEARAVTAWRLF
jgi:hypothetical protein